VRHHCPVRAHERAEPPLGVQHFARLLDQLAQGPIQFGPGGGRARGRFHPGGFEPPLGGAAPADTGAGRAFATLRRDILDMGGTAMLLNSTALAGQTDIFGLFQAARDDEYEEIQDKCQDFHGQLEKEYVAGHFTYAEL